MVFENIDETIIEKSQKFIAICTTKSDFIRAFNIPKQLHLLILQIISLRWSKEIQSYGKNV